MPTLADMKTRIATEMVRADLDTGGALAAQLLLHIQRACEYYANQRFWFNSIVTTAATVAGTQTVSVPATVRTVTRVTCPAYRTELSEYTLETLPDDMASGLPRRYSYYNDSLRLYPIPDAVYTLNIYGVKVIAAPALDADTSVWTNEAYDLISSHTRMTLYRDQFRDPEGTQMAMGAVQDHLARLERETAKRLETPLRASARRLAYDIFTD